MTWSRLSWETKVLILATVGLLVVAVLTHLLHR